MRRFLLLTLAAALAFALAAPALAADRTAPRLASVEIADTRVDGNNREFLLVVSASDDGEMDHITVRFENPDTERTASKVLRPADYSDGAYRGWLRINLFEPDGTFRLDQVTLADAAGNRRIYCRREDVTKNNKKLALPSNPVITLANGFTVLDETAPVFVSLGVAYENVAKDGEVTVTARVTDEHTGVDSVQARFTAPSGRAIVVKLEREGETDLYSGTVKNSSTKEKAQYTLMRVTCTDRAGNSEKWYAVPAAGKKPLPVAATFTLLP